MEHQNSIIDLHIHNFGLKTHTVIDIMTSIVTFTHEDQTYDLHTHIMDGRTLIRASDICEMLGIQNHRKATADLDSDEKCMMKCSTMSGQQSCIMLTSMGVSSIVMKSRKKIAKTFQKWITANKDLARIMKPYRYIRTIPPEIVKQIELILGEP